jgi:hypothetical protein
VDEGAGAARPIEALDPQAPPSEGGAPGRSGKAKPKGEVGARSGPHRRASRSNRLGASRSGTADLPTWLRAVFIFAALGADMLRKPLRPGDVAPGTTVAVAMDVGVHRTMERSGGRPWTAGPSAGSASIFAASHRLHGEEELPPRPPPLDPSLAREPSAGAADTVRTSTPTSSIASRTGVPIGLLACARIEPRPGQSRIPITVFDGIWSDSAPPIGMDTLWGVKMPSDPPAAAAAAGAARSRSRRATR